MDLSFSFPNSWNIQLYPYTLPYFGSSSRSVYTPSYLRLYVYILFGYLRLEVQLNLNPYFDTCYRGRTDSYLHLGAQLRKLDLRPPGGFPLTAASRHLRPWRRRLRPGSYLQHLFDDDGRHRAKRYDQDQPPGGSSVLREKKDRKRSCRGSFESIRRGPQILPLTPEAEAETYGDKGVGDETGCLRGFRHNQAHHRLP